MKAVATRWMYICKGLVSAQVAKIQLFTKLGDEISKAVPEEITKSMMSKSTVTEKAANEINTAAKKLKKTLGEMEKGPELESFLSLLEQLKTFAEDNSVNPDQQSSTLNVIDTLIISQGNKTYQRQGDESEKDTILKVALGSYIFTGIRIDGETEAKQIEEEFRIKNPKKLLRIFEAANNYFSEGSKKSDSESNSHL